jgi:hypothetical protein
MRNSTKVLRLGISRQSNEGDLNFTHYFSQKKKSPTTAGLTGLTDKHGIPRCEHLVVITTAVTAPSLQRA